MSHYWEIVQKVINKSDILLLVLDSRLLSETRHKQIEEKIRQSKKKIIFVANKCDLVQISTLRENIKQLNLSPCVYVSATKHYGASKLRERIKIVSRELMKQEVIVGVLGYPNVGKSSIINLLRGKGVVKTSARAGFTRGWQVIRAGKGMSLIDTPGDLAYNESNEKRVKIGAIAIDKIKEPDTAAADLIEILDGRIEKYYGINNSNYDHAFDVIDAIALKYHMLMKGGEPDTNKASRMILRHWQTGKIN
ncbi:MAG: GTPase [Candidatus Hermodarchaeota archaeon]